MLGLGIQTKFKQHFRVISYYKQDGVASLDMVIDGVSRTMVVPSGFAAIVPRKILWDPHRHGAQGRCISFIMDVNKMPDFDEAIGNNDSAQFSPTHIDLSYFDKWDPAVLFQGPPYKWYWGVMTNDRWAMYQLRGPKVRGQRRLMTKRAARTELFGMTEEEIEKLAKLGSKYLSHSMLQCF